MAITVRVGATPDVRGVAHASAQLEDAFDRKGFALALHPLLVEVAGAAADTCKTRFVRTEGSVVGDGAGDDGIAHVMIGLLPGRSPEVKARLSEGALELLRRCVTPGSGLRLHASAEVRDLDASYRKSADA
ncbi:5-carboxymethyl-2-hydroxymuconate Delta-isomerase [Streptomyces sp. NPDC087300]|uniref:5-carboxymethyl-2-hydroxymuconate Delta-isomerase n=1 Tax=Streptomyces sp. NPDC087300 TaxID=3365780 RepID=UPI0037F8E3DE